MGKGRKFGLGAALIVAAAVVLAGWWTYAEHEKRSEQRAIAALVGQSSELLRQALAAPATPGSLEQAEALLDRLHKTPSSRQRELAQAADVYLVGVRAIIQRRVAVVELEQRANASRQALAAHMRAARGHNDSWIRRAAELKKRMDEDQAILNRTLDALAELIYSMPVSEKPLIPHMERSLLIEMPLLDAAVKRTQAEAKRSAGRAADVGSLR